MVNINQLSTFHNLKNVSQETSKATKQDGADFLSLLKDIQARNTSLEEKDVNTAIKAPNFSGSVANFIGTPATSGTEAFLSTMKNVKNANPLYNAIDTVNKAQIKANVSAAAFASGYGDELQVTMDVSKAEQYLQFFSEVRVKFVNAIKELARTQI